MYRRRWLAVFAACVVLLAACGVAPVKLDPALTAQLPTRHEITDTPFFVQDAYQCGPAALAMVLSFHGHARAPADLTPWIFTPDAKGSFPAELDAVSRREGFISYPVDRFDNLLREVAAGHPVLVLQNLGTDWLTRWHFAVVVGFDLQRRELVLRSGDLARRITPFTLFDTTWNRSGRWGRAVLPPDTLPASAEPQRYLKAAAALEQTGPAPAALQAFRSAARQWPEQPLAHFGLGTGLYGQKDFTGARRAFETLLSLQPDLAAGWNNYAYTLQSLGCPAQAHKAAACAVALAPGQSTFTSTLSELVQPATADNTSCPEALTCPLP